MDSIFKRYYSKEQVTDKYVNDGTDAVDVIIPIIHTNELWEKNLISFYREIPIKRLLIGDGGCIDDSLEIAKKFPRVTVYDHKKFTSLGFSIKKLVESVETPWFIYLHSDVYLPDGWFLEMKKNNTKYDWFECRQQITALIEYPLDYTGINRPFSGSQMGSSQAVKEAVKKIDDDYLYRNEDIIIADLIKKNGYRYGRLDSTFHYHQVMFKASTWGRKLTNVEFIVEKDHKEDLRESTTQSRGIIKYLEPSDGAADMIQRHLMHLIELKEFNEVDFKKWVRVTSPKWLPLISSRLRRIRIILFLKKIYHLVMKIRK